MIRNLTIERFKSLVKLELELGRINVFVGANGSGKTNLLEAIGVLGAAAFGLVDDETLQRRGVRPGVPQLYRKGRFVTLRSLAELVHRKPDTLRDQYLKKPVGERQAYTSVSRVPE
jgi:predicted ATPase